MCRVVTDVVDVVGAAGVVISSLYAGRLSYFYSKTQIAELVGRAVDGTLQVIQKYRYRGMDLVIVVSAQAQGNINRISLGGEYPTKQAVGA